VAGYVRNLPDGQVELWAEGEAKEVEAFLHDLARHMAGYIVGQKVVDETVQGMTGFTIRH
jgi:acylphosphatase